MMDTNTLALATGRRDELMPISPQITESMERSRRRTSNNNSSLPVTEAVFRHDRWSSSQPCSAKLLEPVGCSACVAIDPLRHPHEVATFGQPRHNQPADSAGVGLCRRHQAPLRCRDLSKHSERLIHCHAWIVSSYAIQTKITTGRPTLTA